MKDLKGTDASSNVIKVEFAAKRENDIPVEISHPASKHFPVEKRQTLLSDFDSLVESHRFKDDYIFHHDQKWDYKGKFSDPLSEVVNKISSQIQRIKEDTKRIKFYLDDL